jgi:CheY-like chemotaxis protein
VVEDNADVRMCLQTLLEMEGNQVRVASDGIKGTDLILSWRPDVAIVDIGLPGRDGFSVAKEVRNTLSVAPTRPQPCLIALTGYGLPSDRQKVLEAGYQVHLVKPVNLEELADVLRQLGRKLQAAGTQ